MRIALVAEDYYPQVGGVAEHVRNLALQLTGWGHSVTVVSSQMSGEDPGSRSRPYPVIRIGTSVVIYANGGVSRVTVGFNLGRRLEEGLRAGRFDVDHVPGGLPPASGALTPDAASRAGFPVVATFHSWFPSSIWYRLFRGPVQRVLDRHAANIAVSQPVADAHARYLRAQWEIIPNGVDTEHFHPNGRGPAAASTDWDRAFCYLHRFEPRNHLKTLLAPMPVILSRYPGATLTVM